jgi:hypothetical protein
MATYSLNQLINIFEEFSTNHYQINSFGFGEIWEANGDPKTTGNTPTLWVFPTQAQVTDNTVIYSFDVRCWDLVTKGEGNENDVLSDTQQILSDFVLYIKHESFNFGLVGEPTMTPFTEQLADEVTGWQLSIDIEVNKIDSDCQIPISGGASEPSTYCEPAYVTDGDEIVQVASGDSYTCSGGAGSFTYDLYFDGVDTGEDVTVDGTNITINLT